MRRWCWLLAILFGVGWAQRIDQVPNPRMVDSGWVVDMAGVLSAQQKAQLNEMLSALERDTGVEMAVVILQRTMDAEPKEFATELFNRWGVGKRGEDNGVLVLVALQQRRIEVETGYGIEGILPDSEIGTLLQDLVVPTFRRGDYAGGLIALVGELSQRIRDRSAGDYTPNRSPVPNPFGTVAIVLLMAGGLGVALWLILRERSPQCPTCRQPMRLLSEQQDDAYLNPLQLLEEQLGSVDYRVWRCDMCQTLEIRPVVRWWSGYERCPKCGARTLQTTSHIVREPTYRRTGLELIRKVCRNPRCDYEDEQRRILPRRQRVPTVVIIGGGMGRGGGWTRGGWSGGGWSGGGWSGGGGSFGGGRSGGGGAGASW
jgi:uncharacterized protein